MSARRLAVLACAALAMAQVPASAADLAAGKTAFAPCASCHQVGAYAHAGFGPQLNGVLGRRVGSTKDFKYSEAMQKAGFVWDERTLGAFIKDPEKVVPGTKMRFFGLGYDEKKLADLMAYLRSNPALP